MALGSGRFKPPRIELPVLLQRRARAVRGGLVARFDYLDVRAPTSDILQLESVASSVY